MALVSFKQHLDEAATGKLMHLTHLEDLMLDQGASGAAFALDVLDQFGHMLEHGGVPRSLNVTTKWDGAPSVVFGPDPADGKFFVATKAAFSKNPKLMKSHEQIADTYGDGGVADKLHACFAELSALRPKQILQGDLLFTDDVSTKTIEGKSFLTFRPNTILYAVDHASHLGQQIARAHLGIVVHTMYQGSGKTIEGYHSTPISPTVFAGLAKTARVVVVDAAFDDLSGTVTFTNEEQADFNMSMSRVRALHQEVPAAIYHAVTMEPLHALMQMFINQRVRENRVNASTIGELMEFIATRRDKEAAGRSSEKGKQDQLAKFNTIMTQIRENARGYLNWFMLHQAIMNAKTIIVRKLGQASRVQTFVPSENGFRVTGPEGFVATSHSGQMVKLVDRLEFSRLNFLAPKDWQ